MSSQRELTSLFFNTGLVQLEFAGLPHGSCWGSLGHLLFGVIPMSIFIAATGVTRTHAGALK